MKIKNGLIGLLVGGVAFGGMASASTQKVIDVQQVQDAIKKNHANWTAKETNVAKLSKEEAIRMMGLKGPLPSAHLDFRSTTKTRTPSAYDWRNVNGADWVGEVMNQGNCGSCVAFATVGVLTAQSAISAGLPWLHATYSPEQLFECGGGGCESGWMPDAAAAFLQFSGIVDEACMPYTLGSTGQDVDCSAKCSDADSRTTKTVGTTTPTIFGGSVDAVKAALLKGPLVTTLTVYADFVTYSGGVYKHVTGDALGGHAIGIYGWDDSKQAWLIRNSWGPEWGEKGYGWMAYDDESGVGGSTTGFEMGTPSGYVSVVSPADSEYVSGQYQMTASVSGAAHAADVQFHLSNLDGVEVATVRSASGSAATVDTTQMKDGVYTVYADSASAGIKSQIRQFTVINHAPSGLSLTMKPVEGVDLTQPLNGRPEFYIAETASPVALQEVEFRAIDSNGQIAARKSNTYVLPNMRMGWRTMTVADGQYKILFHGTINYLGKTYSVDSNSYTITVKN